MNGGAAIASTSMNFSPDFSKLVDQGIWGGGGDAPPGLQAPQLTNQLTQMPTAPPPLPMAPPPMLPGRRTSMMVSPMRAPVGGGGAVGGSAGAGPTYQGNASGRALIEDAARKAGFTGDALRTAIAIGMAESQGNAHSLNNNPRTGDLSYGLFQINMLGNMGPSRLKQYGLANNDALYDPYVNARVAYQMSGGGKNFSPWSTYKSGVYRQYY